MITPLGVVRDSTRSSALSGPVSGNSRVPWPKITGTVSRLSSSTSSLSNSQRHRLPLPCTCRSPTGLALSSPMADARSPERTVVSAQLGSVSVVDATYLGFVFNAVQIGLSPGSSHVPQEPAKRAKSSTLDIHQRLSEVPRPARRSFDFGGSHAHLVLQPARSGRR